jgi:hypothetical protein
VTGTASKFLTQGIGRKHIEEAKKLTLELGVPTGM